MSTLFPPFDPDEAPHRARFRQLPKIPIRLILPNLVTLLALCAGLTSIRMATEGAYIYAVSAILFAGLLDGVDGRLARFLKSTSRFGAQMDSLADFVNFGVAPAVLLYAWTLNGAGSLGWMACLVYAVCAALRLARFNAALDGPAKPDWQADYFVGVPAPAGAGTVLLPLYLEFLGLPHNLTTTPITFLYTIAIGLLMISRLPTWSGKMVGKKIPRDMVLPIFVLVVLGVAFLVSFPWQVMSLATVAYLACIPLSRKAWLRRKEEEAAKPPPVLLPGAAAEGAKR
ncbi:MAG: phosphatidylcholine/phosphatidylserine synthase [Bauldia sp.]